MLNVLIVDDESLARQRLRFLLQSMTDPACTVQEAAAASQAQQVLERSAGNAPVDLVLLDIHMPGMDGMAWARQLRAAADAPAIVFVTAHAEYAAQAFDLEAVDYLTKPVRLERLRQAVKRVMQQRAIAHGAAGADAASPAGNGEGANPAAVQAPGASILITDRHRAERVPLEQVLFCRSELKYITIATAQQDYLFDGSLTDLERRFPDCFLRVHRSAIVARKAIRGLVKAQSPEEGEHWRVQLHGSEETLPVSRRLLPAVRDALLRE